MGTRHVIKVINGKETRVAQYGQWDGYPSGQGVAILEFLRDKKNIKKLQEKLSQVRFLDDKKDKDFMDAYNKNAPQWSNEPDNRTKEQKAWFDTYMSRDISSEILKNIVETEEGYEILLRDESEFEKDGLMCEWAYTINLDTMVLKVWDREFDINNLPSDKEFIDILEPNDDE